MLSMSRWVVVVALAMVACGSDVGGEGDAELGSGDAVDAGVSERDAGVSEIDAAAMPDAAPPTCVAWVDECHVRACPGGEVSMRPDGTPCPAERCGPDGAGKPCACRDGECRAE